MGWADHCQNMHLIYQSLFFAIFAFATAIFCGIPLKLNVFMTAGRNIYNYILHISRKTMLKARLNTAVMQKGTRAIAKVNRVSIY